MKEEVSMSITLRPSTLDDAKQCGEICYSAFRAIAEEHNFPPDFLSPELAITLLSEFMAHPHIYGVVAELDGRVVGSNFVDERSIIAGIGKEFVAGEELDESLDEAVAELVAEAMAD